MFNVVDRYLEAIMSDKFVTHKGGCHCGAVCFEVKAPAVLELDECNCSICAMSGYQHYCLPFSQFRLISGLDNLQLYQFGSGTAKHPFCKTCGIKSFYHPRAYTQGVSINANCLNPETIEEMRIVRRFNGREWEKTFQDNAYQPPGE